ncbi:acetoacetyl-CoA synthetase [Actinomycetospora sp. NBRC 106375]|uniref:acetoacetate--CoA ligase n=1 Tax=Actinomycetospora sp. NBRC 106375 TaxID=3032207 RepID=UPI0024A483D1|nr:acetoacetate--CoA ligase [Actinomycetospora sp. NBRC 106375]GLZ44179.1 acetoacetyl-CoA synthetase [Actinomycetospora sp. NBRC 106375]
MAAPAGTVIGRFVDWLARERGLAFDDYDALQRWSVTDLDGFWSAVAAFFAVRFHDAPRAVLENPVMPGAVWFPGATLNYAERAVEGPPGVGAADDTVILAYSQTRDEQTWTRAELRDAVARARAGLQRLGVRAGDRVVAYAPNIPETVVAHLAAASLGAVWASCAPEFGARSVVDRFAQIEPTVLLAVGGYVYGDKPVDRTSEVAALRAALPTLRHVVGIPYGPGTVPDATPWSELVGTAAEPAYDPVPFDHPLMVLFSSGTTGPPKAIVHGHGGITVEHLKNHGLAWDVQPGDRLLWFTTTAWMMWNALLSGLIHGAALILVDGNPLHPDLAWQWRLAAQARATHFGTSPAFLMTCRSEGVHPARDHDLAALRQICVAGSPLPPEGYRWVAAEFGPAVLLLVGSGGTDVCSGIVQGGPWQDVVEGEISGRELGVDTAAFDEAGNEVVGERGELVIRSPMPSMPLFFWGDDDGSRRHAAYFDTYPGIWRHGDWVRFSPTGSVVVSGRSDATLNRGGVRLGTAEFYAVVEEMPEVTDSLVVHLEDPGGGPGELLLFVVPAAGHTVDEARVRAELRAALSPRHVPDRIHAIAAVPRTRTGKKLEVPAKRILLGADPDAVASRDSLVDPDALTAFVGFAR